MRKEDRAHAAAAKLSDDFVVSAERRLEELAQTDRPVTAWPP
jgi:hypothetical protein